VPRSAPPGASSGSPSASDHDFAEICLASRDRLLLQAYALTGERGAAATAVHDAYAAAAHRWRRVRSLADPEAWIRARVYERAVPAGRRLRGTGDETGSSEPEAPEAAPDEQQQRVLVALRHLGGPARKVLVLTHLAGLDLAATGAELGTDEDRVTALLHEALEAMRRWGALDDVAGPAPEASDLGPHVSRRTVAALHSLAPLLDDVARPDPAQLGSSARRGPRLRAAVAAVVTLALLVGLVLWWPGAGVLSGTEDAGSQTADPDGTASPSVVPVEEGMLLGAADVRRLAPQQSWSETGTSDNTDGDGINTVCQADRFADPEGEGTLVRTFAAAGAPARTVLQTVEVSRTTSAAVDAYRTTLDWFAGCREARLQLLGSYRVDGIGASAEVLELRVPTADQRRTYVVGVVRTGEVTVSTVTETRGGAPVGVVQASLLLREAAERLCEASAAGSCPGRARVVRVLPPLSGETRGTLAAADLPPIGRVDRAWVGTRPAPARPNAAATSCDGANFVRNGAPQAKSRTFVIPGARLPARFGITQTVGEFPRPARAEAFVEEVVAAMAACEDDDLSAQVQRVQFQPTAFRGSSLAVWRLDSEVAENRSVGFWMGLARVGPYVSQVLFTPTAGADLDADQFRAVATRARDRLFELTGGPR
jgi:DNA-directed RNA polymerase specialized sigma24 family protein